VDSRQHLKALQAQVSAARAAFDAGDRDKALLHLDQALSIDPSFLAAQSLREQVLAAGAARVAPAPPKAPASRIAATREAYERIELRAKQRRVDHCIAATRAALGRQQPEAATAALAELIALEPHETNVASLSAELADLRRRTSRRPLGVRLAAASAFLAVAGTASWLEHPRPPTPAPVARTAAIPTTVPAEALLLKSRVFAAPSVTRPPELAPSALRRVPDTPLSVPDTERIAPASPVAVPLPARVPAPTPTRTAPSIAATAPLSLPTPLSQLASSDATAPSVPPPASITAGSPVAATTPIRPPNDQDLIQDALQRYRRAYGRLNVQSAEAVYPSVNRVALARAFGSLESQAITFDMCDVEVSGSMARAICHGTTRYVPKVGSRYPRTEPLVWSFELRKAEGDWTIYYAKASR